MELEHLAQYDAILQDCILQSPNEYLPVVRAPSMLEVRQGGQLHLDPAPCLSLKKPPGTQLHFPSP